MVRQKTQRLSRSERRTQLLDAARELLADKGFRGVTTAEIAKAAGISEPILYRHFSSKKNLLRSLMQDVIIKITGELEQLLAGKDNPLEALREVCHGYSRLATQYEQDFRIIHRALAEADDPELADLLREHYEAYAGLLTTCIRKAQKQKSIRTDIPATVAAWHLIHAAIGFVSTAPLGSRTQRSPAYNRHLADLALAGLLR